MNSLRFRAFLPSHAYCLEHVRPTQPCSSANPAKQHRDQPWPGRYLATRWSETRACVILVSSPDSLFLVLRRTRPFSIPTRAFGAGAGLTATSCLRDPWRLRGWGNFLRLLHVGYIKREHGERFAAVLFARLAERRDRRGRGTFRADITQDSSARCGRTSRSLVSSPGAVGDGWPTYLAGGLGLLMGADGKGAGAGRNVVESVGG